MNLKKINKENRSWDSWKEKKDRFKETGFTTKGKNRAINVLIVGKGKSRISGNTYSH